MGSVKSDLGRATARSECAASLQRRDIDDADPPVTWMARVQQAMIGAHGQRDRAGLVLDSRNALAARQRHDVEPVVFVRRVQRCAIQPPREKLRSTRYRAMSTSRTEPPARVATYRRSPAGCKAR